MIFYDDEEDEFSENFYIDRTVHFKDGTIGIIYDVMFNNIPCCAMLVTLLINKENCIQKLESTKVEYIDGKFYER